VDSYYKSFSIVQGTDKVQHSYTLRNKLTLATNLSLTRMFSVFRSLCITDGRSECRYFIPQTIPWANDSFNGQSTYRQQFVTDLSASMCKVHGWTDG